MRTTTEIRNLSDTELLEYICTVGNDEVGYNEFVNRYIKDVQKLCQKICRRRRLHDHVGLQICHDALQKLRGLKSFNRNKLRAGDQRKSILGFVYVICINLFNDHHNKVTRQFGSNHGFYLDDLAEAFKVSGKIDNHRRKELSERILKKLSPKEQKVLLTDMEYKRHQVYLPDEVVASLCEELKVSQSALRKIRERLKTKISKEIDVINGKQ